MTVVLFVRHASNDYVKEGRLAGRLSGIHINAQGQREADELARRLNHVPIAAIYSSPLERAVDTARAIALCQKLDVQIRGDLGEVDCGEWTGKLIKELDKSDAWKVLQTKPSDFTMPGGESIAAMQQRMVVAIDAIVRQHPKQVVAIVSHADPLKAAIAHYLGMDLDHFQRIIVNPASVTVFFLEENNAALFRLNDSGPLPDFKPEPEKKREEADDAKG